MNAKIMLSEEFRRLVKARMKQTIEGIENTLQHILQSQEISLEKLKEEIQGLEESFNLLSQKWNLEILYILFLRKICSFNDLKKTLAINSRTLSDKLKILRRHKYIERIVEDGPPLRVRYTLTKMGRDTVLLALPLLYYSSRLNMH
ncbi:MAG: winged helix-turn-helix transcriptional regulator [Candidatus Bathyarchaeales archaeon]